MKKTKVVGTLALASCVMLSGCNLFKKKVLSVADLPHLVAGEQFDLQSYVTAQGYKGSFSVVPSEESKGFLTVDESGTKITASHSGDIKFTVNYGKLSAEVAAVVDSKEYVEYAKITKEKVYEFEITKFDLSSGDPALGENFTKDYYLYAEPSSSSVSYGGMTSIDGRVFSFSLAVGEDSVEVDQFFISGGEPESMESICRAFPLTGENGKSKYIPAEGNYEAYEAISFTDEKLVEEATDYIFGYSKSLLANNGFAEKEIQMSYEEDTLEDGSKIGYYFLVLLCEYKNDEGQTEVGGIDYCAVSLGSDAVWFPGLEEEFPSTKPASAAVAADFEYIQSVLAGENYTLSFGSGWEEKVGTGEWADYTSTINPFLEEKVRKAFGFYDEEEDTLGYYIADYLNANDSGSIFVRPDQTLSYHVVGGVGYDIGGLVEHDGDVYSYKPHATIASTYAATKVAQSAEISSPALAGSPYSLQFLNGFGDVFYNARMDLGEGGIAYEFAYNEAYDVFHALFCRAFPEVIAYKSYSQCSSSEEFVLQCEDIGNMFALLDEDFATLECYLFINQATGSIGVQFTYDAGSAKIDGAVHAYRYTVFASIYAVGATEIPTQYDLPIAY